MGGDEEVEPLLDPRDLPLERLQVDRGLGRRLLRGGGAAHPQPKPAAAAAANPNKTGRILMARPRSRAHPRSRLHDDRRPIREDLGDPRRDFVGIVANPNDPVRPHLVRVLNHQIEGLLARVLAQLGVEGDVTAEERLDPRADIANDAARADGDPRTTPSERATRELGSSKEVVMLERFIGLGRGGSPIAPSHKSPGAASDPWLWRRESPQSRAMSPAAETARPAAPPAASPLARNSVLVAACVGLSRVLGYARDSALGALFGASPTYEALRLAFNVPNFLRRLLGEGAFTGVFLPMFQRARARGGDGAARELVQIVGGAQLVVLCALAIVGSTICVFLPPSVLAHLLEKDPGRAPLLLQYLAILIPYLVPVCLYAFAMAILNARSRFFVPAIAPFFQNVVALGAFLLAWGWPAPSPTRAPSPRSSSTSPRGSSPSDSWWGES